MEIVGVTQNYTHTKRLVIAPPNHPPAEETGDIPCHSGKYGVDKSYQ